MVKIDFFAFFFGEFIYPFYFCAEFLKKNRSVAKKGNELSSRKFKDFIAKFDEVQRSFRQQGLNYNIAAICKMVASLPAPRFYINSFEALKQYSLFKRGMSNIHSESRRRMYAEIFARFDNLTQVIKATGQKVSKSEIMKRVLSQEAPCFYYSDDSALKMYYRMMQRKRKTRRL